MAGSDILSAILHYKRNIDKICDPPERALKYEDRLLHCINKLYKLPVNVSHLQETGVGRTVNALRKIEGVKGLGDAAKALVAKWKTMVMLEDEAERKQREECSGPSEEELNKIKLIREAEKSELKKTENNSNKIIQYQSNNGGKSHEGSKHNGIESSHNNTNSNSRKRKHELEESDRNHSKRIYNNTELGKVSGSNSGGKDAKEKLKSYPHTNKGNEKSNHKSSSSYENQEHIKEERKKEKDRERKRENYKSSSSKHSSENSANKHQKPYKNHEKYESKDRIKPKEYPENDGFDSQSGASFEDALGPMLLKRSLKKKSNCSSTIPSLTSSDHSLDNNVSTSKEKKADVKDLLFSQPKLEPLEPDLVATLPTPTPFYKPHPSYIPTQEAVRRRVQAEEDALTTIMSNKNTRTKVFSGVKGGLSYVPSLYECCCRILQQHIDALEYTGGIPFSLLKPILEGATPSQLYRFEHFNPYIIEDTDDLWKFHISKEFRNEKRLEFESWRDMYLRCIDEREEKYKAVTANIIQRTIENSVPVRKAKLAYIDSPKPPRNILKKQIKNGTAKLDSSRLLGKNDPEAVKVSAPKQPTTKEPAVFKTKPKVAPLMQKTLKSIKMSRFKR